MNILLWVVQGLLAFLCFSGGGYKVFKTADVVKLPVNQFLPSGAWSALGVLEMVCAILLVVPLAVGWMPVLTPAAAAVVAAEDLTLSVVYARRSTKLVAANPLVWVGAGALLAALVAFGRHTA